MEPLFVETDIVVDDVNIYALKSGAASTVDGEHPRSLEISSTGMEAYGIKDRQLVVGSVVDEEAHSAHLISLRGKDVNGQIRYPGDAVLSQVRTDISSLGHVCLTLPNGSEFNVIPLEIDKDNVAWRVNIHDRTFIGTDLGPEIGEAFTELLSSQPVGRRHAPVRDVRVFAQHPNVPRFVRDEHRRLDTTASGIVSGADSGQLLVTNQATLRDLEEVRGVTVEESVERGNMRRSRGNITLGGAIEAGDEDLIDALRIGDATELIALDGCVRCLATGVHPDSGMRDNSFLPLIKERNLQSVATGEEGLFFGTQFAPVMRASNMSIRVGDPVAVKWAAESNVRERGE